jgi:hypothetical protein
LVQIVPVSPVTRTNGFSDLTGSTGVQNYVLSLPTIPNGATIFGAFFSESCFNPPSQPGCTGSGDFDHVDVGGQTAPVIARYANARYVGDGLGMTVWWMPNVQGNPTVTLVTNGGGMWYDGSLGSIFTGVPPTATVDAVSGGPNFYGYASGGPLGACCSDGNLTSPSVTPSVSGDLLYGVGTTYGCYSTQYGTGWSAGSVSTNYFGKIDEWQIDNSTSPIGAVFPGSCGAGTSAYVGTVAIKVH